MKFAKASNRIKLAAVASLALLQSLNVSAADMQNWMGNLSDNLNLSDLSIPGTHNSATFRAGSDSADMFEDVYAQCQDITITDQLSMGIRVFDLRVRQNGSDLALHHGSVFLNKMLSDVLANFNSFLSKHPRETIFVRIGKANVEPLNSSGTLAESFMRYWNNSSYARYFWKPTSQTDNPKLSSVRGKIVILKSSYMDYSALLDVKSPNWGKFDIQDEWEVQTPLDIPDKWTDVKNQLANSSNLNNKKVHVNFTSGSGWLATPSYIAGFINSDLKTYLNGKSIRTGIVMMDFPNRTNGLIESIVSMNKAGQCQWLNNETGEWDNYSNYSTKNACESANQCGYGACYRWKQ